VPSKSKLGFTFQIAGGVFLGLLALRLADAGWKDYQSWSKHRRFEQVERAESASWPPHTSDALLDGQKFGDITLVKDWIPPPILERYTEDQLKTALVAAGNAGDAKAANVFAVEIKRRVAPPKQ